jgi:hypothetical protein
MTKNSALKPENSGFDHSACVSLAKSFRGARNWDHRVRV